MCGVGGSIQTHKHMYIYIYIYINIYKVKRAKSNDKGES
jgi:hypothetical protein